MYMNYITTAEAAEALGVAEQTIRAYLADGKLRGRRIGGKFRAIWQVERNSVLKFLEKGGRSVKGRKAVRKPNPHILGDK
jgi:excisionase family DNA binding protein